jgi:hypothetical protein
VEAIAMRSRIWRVSQVRHDAKHPLDQHQLAAVMHLVFLGAQQHLEAGFGRRRHAGGVADTLREKVVGLALQPLCPPLPFVAQKGDDLCLAARPLLLGHDAPHKLRKVESF